MAKDLQNLQLPPFVIADFYKDCLVESTEQRIAPPKPTNTIIQEPVLTKTTATIDPNKKIFLGNNAKQIAIVVKDAEAVFLNEEALQFLGNILGACKLNLGDIAIINHLQTPANFSLIKTQTQCKFLLLFDIVPSALELPFLIPQYQVFPHGGCTFLCAPALSTINGNSAEAKLEKSKLWVCLKKMFGI
jgi:hypothetical protein